MRAAMTEDDVSHHRGVNMFGPQYVRLLARRDRPQDPGSLRLNPHRVEDLAQDI
jgi:hypothetical protein